MDIRNASGKKTKQNVKLRRTRERYPGKQNEQAVFLPGLGVEIVVDTASEDRIERLFFC